MNREARFYLLYLNFHRQLDNEKKPILSQNDETVQKIRKQLDNKNVAV